jgi:hypothetical protein
MRDAKRRGTPRAKPALRQRTPQGLVAACAVASVVVARSGGAQQSDRAGLGLVRRVCHWMPPLRSANAAWSRVALHECGVELGSSRGVELGGRVALGSVTTGITSTWKVRMRARSLGRRSRRGCFRPSPRVRPHGARRELALRRK